MAKAIGIAGSPGPTRGKHHGEDRCLPAVMKGGLVFLHFEDAETIPAAKIMNALH